MASPVVVGRVARPHGIRGQVVVNPETDFGETRFRPGSVLQASRAGETFDVTIVASRPYDGRWVIGFEGVESIDDAETLRGVELLIPEEALTPLEEGRYYLHDLVGCRVVTTGGEAVGDVARVDSGGGPALLVVLTALGEALVPFADTICRRVDVAAKIIVIEPIEGLLDLNAPGRGEVGR